MNKQEKAQVINSLHTNFQENDASFLIGFKGLSVKQMQNLRKKLRQNNAELKVAKARLMKRAVGDIEGAQDLNPYLKDQVGLVFAKHDFSALAKVLRDFAKENEALTIVAGFMESRVFDGQSIVRIADLPSKQVLLAQLCGLLKAPTRNFVSLLNTMIVRLVIVLKAAADKKAA